MSLLFGFTNFATDSLRILSSSFARRLVFAGHDQASRRGRQQILNPTGLGDSLHFGIV
jgi:hypothetical protein